MLRPLPSVANLPLPSASISQTQTQTQTPLPLSPSRGPWEGKVEKIYTDKLRTSSPTGLAAIRKAERELADNLKVLGQKVKEGIERGGREEGEFEVRKEGGDREEAGKEELGKESKVRKEIEVTKTIKMKCAIQQRRRTASSSSGAGKAQLDGGIREASGPRTRSRTSGEVPSYAASTMSSRARSCEKK